MSATASPGQSPRYPDHRRREALRGHAAMLAFALVISVSFVLGDRAAPHIGAGAITAVRFLLAAVVAGVIAAPLIRAVHFRAPWRFAAMGGLFGAYFVLMFEGLKRTDPVSLAAVFTLMPIMSGAFGWLLMRQITTPGMALALLVGGAGALWVIFRGDLDALLSFQLGLGEALFLIGCACHALYTPLVAKLSRGEPAPAFGLGVLLGGLVVTAGYGAAEIAATDWTALAPVVWYAIAYLGVMATVVSFILMRFAALRLPASKVMAYGYLVPSFVILWEGVLTGAWVAAPVWLGVVATLMALGLLLRDERG
ncbi:MAG: DMT family transporter [Pseudomonadota bacterium]